MHLKVSCATKLTFVHILFLHVHTSFIPNLLFQLVISFVQVNENGVISFNKVWSFSHPKRFPTYDYKTRENAWALAAFWSDIDIRKSGTIQYLNISSLSTDPQEIEILQKMSAFFSSEFAADDELPFRGTWLLIVHWDHVHPSPHGENDQQENINADLKRVIIFHL